MTGDTLWASGRNQSPPAEKHLEIYKYLHLITPHLEPTRTRCTLNTPSERKRLTFDQWILLTKEAIAACCSYQTSTEITQAGTYNRCTEIQHELLNTWFTLTFSSCLLFLMRRCGYLRINRLTQGNPGAL